MTLIVSRIEQGKLYIFGDTELTLHSDVTANPFAQGCLKIYRLSDKLAVAFSGLLEHFESVSNSILSCNDANETVQICIDSQAKGLDFEILVAEIGYDKIRFVKEGSLHEAVVGYIGDQYAFNAFQTYYHGFQTDPQVQTEMGRASIQFLRLPEPILENEIYHAMYMAFKRVIWDETVGGVGGVIIPLCSDKEIFRYMNYADVVSDPLRVKDFGPEPKRIEFGTPERGGYSVEFCDDSPHGGAGCEVGFYFLQGGFGVIFPRSKTGIRHAEVIKSKNPASWVLETHKKLGNGICSQFMNEDHCGILGEELLKAEKYEDALFCYELRKDSKSLKDRTVVMDRYCAGHATALFNCRKADEAIELLQSHIRNSDESRRSEEILKKILEVIEKPLTNRST